MMNEEISCFKKGLDKRRPRKAAIGATGRQVRHLQPPCQTIAPNCQVGPIGHGHGPTNHKKAPLQSEALLV